MNKYAILGGMALALSLPATGALAEGDAKRGEAVFKRCVTCHAVGPNAKKKVGPILNDLYGRQAGTTEGYNYSAINKSAGEAGLKWSTETLAQYLPEPNKFLVDFLTKAGKADQAKGRTKMTFRLTNEEQIADVIAYLKQFSKPAN